VEVQIKDLILGSEIAGLSKDRDDYLQKRSEAQFAVGIGRPQAVERNVIAVLPVHPGDAAIFAEPRATRSALSISSPFARIEINLRKNRTDEGAYS
jgi:hypothetical protein